MLSAQLLMAQNESSDKGILKSPREQYYREGGVIALM
jgi:hypothetical protein